MDYKMIEIYNKPAKIKGKKYNFIIEEKWVTGWGRTFAKGRRRPKSYKITENGKLILLTSLHQTFYKMQKDIMEGR